MALRRTAPHRQTYNRIIDETKKINKRTRCGTQKRKSEINILQERINKVRKIVPHSTNSELRGVGVFEINYAITLYLLKYC